MKPRYDFVVPLRDDELDDAINRLYCGCLLSLAERERMAAWMETKRDITTVPEALQSARFDGIVDGAKREADKRAFRAAITDEDVEKALEAANGAMVDTRRHWTAEDRAAVRAMLAAVFAPSPLARSQEKT